MDENGNKHVATTHIYTRKHTDLHVYGAVWLYKLYSGVVALAVKKLVYDEAKANGVKERRR